MSKCRIYPAGSETKGEHSLGFKSIGFRISLLLKCQQALWEKFETYRQRPLHELQDQWSLAAEGAPSCFKRYSKAQPKQSITRAKLWKDAKSCGYFATACPKFQVSHLHFMFSVLDLHAWMETFSDTFRWLTMISCQSQISQSISSSLHRLHASSNPLQQYSFWGNYFPKLAIGKKLCSSHMWFAIRCFQVKNGAVFASTACWSVLNIWRGRLTSDSKCGEVRRYLFMTNLDSWEIYGYRSSGSSFAPWGLESSNSLWGIGLGGSGRLVPWESVNVQRRRPSMHLDAFWRSPPPSTMVCSMCSVDHRFRFCLIMWGWLQILDSQFGTPK